MLRDGVRVLIENQWTCLSYVGSGLVFAFFLYLIAII
jgi:hypothetical protein